MFRNSGLRVAITVVVLFAALALLRYRPWERAGADAGGANGAHREMLKVGFLPVTCHLTCPVTDFATKKSGTTRFESQLFTDFPTMVESMKADRLEATFMIAPLAMKLREQGLPVKILYLGHRDGSTVIVRKDLQGDQPAGSARA